MKISYKIYCGQGKDMTERKQSVAIVCRVAQNFKGEHRNSARGGKRTHKTPSVVDPYAAVTSGNKS